MMRRSFLVEVVRGVGQDGCGGRHPHLDEGATLAKSAQPVADGRQRSGGIQHVVELLVGAEPGDITSAGDGAKLQRSGLPFLVRVDHADVHAPGPSCHQGHQPDGSGPLHQHRAFPLYLPTFHGVQDTRERFD